MRTLMVTKFVPWPDNSGGRRRSLAIARRLADKGEVVLCAYDGGTGAGELERLGVDVRSVPWHPHLTGAATGLLRTGSVSAGRFFSAALARQVRRAAEEAPVDLLQVEYLQMAFVAGGVRAGRRVLDLHNVESALMSSYERAASGWRALAGRAEASALRRAERRVLPRYDTVVVVSEQERRRLPAGAREVLVCPNGWEPSPAPLPPATTPTAIFVGVLDWAPNIDAVGWFCREVWPAVTRRAPDARLLLVGRDPGPGVRSLAGPTVEVWGTVPEVAPLLARARVAVAPLRSGGGSRLKILEALDGGRPVVATTVAVDGLEDLTGRGVVVADTAPSMAQALSDLLGDAARAETLGRAGHEAVHEAHAWDRTLAPLLEAVAG